MKQSISVHTRNTYSIQGYRIVKADSVAIEACASFKYKDYEISFTTIGYSTAKCLEEVAVFDKQGNLCHTAHSVESAIKYVNSITV